MNGKSIVAACVVLGATLGAVVAPAQARPMMMHHHTMTQHHVMHHHYMMRPPMMHRHMMMHRPM